MGTDCRKFLKTGATVFTVLAWVSLTLQVIVGLVVLIFGGEPVNLGGAELPARLIGILNFVAAAIYWFLFMFISHATRALLDVHSKVTGGGCQH